MRNQHRLLLGALVAALMLGAAVLNQESVAAQGQGPTVTVDGTVAVTQSGPWTVSLAERPYSYSVEATCDIPYRCSVTFPAVPEGAILRVKRLHGFMRFSPSDAFVSLIDDAGAVLFAFPLHAFPAFSTGFGGGIPSISNVLSFNTDTEAVFTAGQSPVLLIGTSPVTPFFDSGNRLGITGTLSAAP